MSDVTQIIARIESGDGRASDELLPRQRSLLLALLGWHFGRVKVRIGEHPFGADGDTPYIEFLKKFSRPCRLSRRKVLCFTDVVGEIVKFDSFWDRMSRSASTGLCG